MVFWLAWYTRFSRQWVLILPLFKSIFFHSNWRDLHFHEHFQLKISSKCDIKAEKSSTLCKFDKGRKGLRLMGSNASRKKTKWRTDHVSRAPSPTLLLIFWFLRGRGGSFQTTIMVVEQKWYPYVKLGKIDQSCKSWLKRFTEKVSLVARPLLSVVTVKKTRITMQAIQTLASALGSYQRISSFKGFGRRQTETIRGQIVFLFSFLFFVFCFYIFFFWRDWTHVLAESQPSLKHVFMQIFLGSYLYVTVVNWITLFII